MPECHVGRLSRDETRNLPAHVARAIAGDSLHSFDELVIEYPPIIAAGHGSQFDMAIVGLQCQSALKWDPSSAPKRDPFCEAVLRLSA
ncbi:hypothetical protein SS37A_38930 (plasmid) [Methylocystis iwaonis]|uniref:Uncharacterized protein n=1 Tax=Methylocystis iwaonis TaxID=2885079 RepID=A0ABM8EEE1_9HYPH|nr:hypothetical protein SS37A_38930 [Methylocystis iwaonis]